ncbi:MAGE family-domain-containing protein [Radiomyces spectabilis]|uniref:MAGE family-domain-containing protein n=1 Tax=Radiomyces spectabilis TaxID=64574 RepID=UPI00221EFAB2|nr:MAGE family-domain-containing protein [Radiomyces spectabilis]KAI8370538.1 MAGE family-domain-containing protein [Radiomyces spectabilis]
MSASQPSKRIRRHDDDDDDDDYGEGPSTQRTRTDDTDAPSTTDWDNEYLERKVKDTVRYALACEFKKQTIRREEISKRVLSERPRMFNVVFRSAQEKLRHIFGMEMVELPLREKPSVANNRKELPGTKLAASRTYILRNVLSMKYNVPELIQYSDEEYTNTGILYVILALILVHEQILEDGELKQHLDRLKITDSSPTFGDRDRLLDTFVKQGYLHRTKTNEPDPNTVPEWEYYWGPRAKAEIPEGNMVEFISSLYGLEGNSLDELKTHIYKSAGYVVRVQNDSSSGH